MKSIYEKLDKISEFVINLGSVQKFKTFDLRSTIMSSAEELISKITNEIDEGNVAVISINNQIDEMTSARDTLENDLSELENVIDTLNNIDTKINEVRASRSSAEQWIQ